MGAAIWASVESEWMIKLEHSSEAYAFTYSLHSHSSI